MDNIPAFSTGTPFSAGSSYRLREGKRSNCKTLLVMMEQAYSELYPDLHTGHLRQTVDQLWSDQTPFWFVDSVEAELTIIVGCLWLGKAVDQITGDRYPHIFLLYIDPTYRRRGLGRALMGYAENWAKLQGDSQIGLHVFVANTPALALYQRLGYLPQAMFLQKSLQNPRES